MDRKTRQLLIDLESDSAKERYVAVVELSKTKNTKLLPQLNKIATLDPNPKVRQVAFQAVKYLNNLKEEQSKVARQARQAQLDAMEDDEDDDDLLDNLLDDDDDDSEDDRKRITGSWNYEEAVKSQHKNVQIKKLSTKKEKRRKRRGFRVFLWLAACVVVVGLAVVAYDRENRRDEPKDRQEALTRLGAWVDDLSEKVSLYQTATSLATFVCSDLETEALDIPSRPKGLGSHAAHQDDLDEFFEHISEAETTLKNTHAEIKRVCETVASGGGDGTFNIAPDWGPKRQVAALEVEQLQPARLILADAEEALKATPTPESTPE